MSEAGGKKHPPILAYDTVAMPDAVNSQCCVEGFTLPLGNFCLGVLNMGVTRRTNVQTI